MKRQRGRILGGRRGRNGATGKGWVPVGDDAVLNGVLEREDASLGLGLVADVGVLLAHADHDALVAGTANDRREHGARGIITREASLHHTGTVIHNERSYLRTTSTEDTSFTRA